MAVELKRGSVDLGAVVYRVGAIKDRRFMPAADVSDESADLFARDWHFLQSVVEGDRLELVHQTLLLHQ